MEVAEVEEVHVRRRVDGAQRAVQVDRRGGERDRHALGDHHLHAVAGEDVLLDGAHRALEVVVAEAGAERRLRAERRGQVHPQARGDRLAQAGDQRIEAGQAGLEGAGLARIGEDDGVQLARQVVEHHHGVGNHQQDVRGAQRVGIGAGAQAPLDVAHAVVAEVADQPAVEARQAGQGRHVVARLELLDEGQRIGALVALGFHAVDAHPRLVAVDAQHRARRQADDRVAAPFLAALHRFEQVGVGRVGQLQVDRQRGVEVGEGFAGERDAVVAGSGQTQEFFTGHDQPRGLVNGRYAKRAGKPARDEIRRASASGPVP